MKEKSTVLDDKFFLSMLASDSVLGYQVNWKNFNPEHFFGVIEKLIEYAKPILSEALCKKGISELLFNNWQGDKKIVTEDWEKLCGGKIPYISNEFAVIGSVPIPARAGCVINKAYLIIDKQGSLFLIDRLRLSKTRQDGKVLDEKVLTVKEFHTISYRDEAIIFSKKFNSLAEKNPTFCRDIVYYGFDKIYLNIINKKEKEFASLMKFKEIREKISFGD